MAVVISLWLVPLGVYSVQVADTRTLHGSALRRTLSVAEALIQEHPLLAWSTRSLSTTMPWEHHFISVVISLWLVPLGVYSFQGPITAPFMAPHCVGLCQ